MKKIGIALLLCLTGFGAFAQNVALDEAIQSVAGEISQRLPQGAKVAVLSFTSPADRLSRYVIDELNDAIVNGGKLTVVDRQQLDLIMQEMQFQESGLVSDESAQEIGRMLGAQYIVSGSMESIASSYRFRARALTVENAAISYSGSRNVAANDRTVASLIAGSSGASGDFTSAERNRARWLNIFWGAGSFSQRDILGGSITALLDVGGLVCIIAGGVVVLSMLDSSIDREEGYWEVKYTFNGQRFNTYADAEAEQRNQITGGAVLAAVGVGLGTAGLVYGFIRPSFAHRPGYVAGTFADPEMWNIALVSDHRGGSALRLAYTMSF
jgi:TolB-like protein